MASKSAAIVQQGNVISFIAEPGLLTISVGSATGTAVIEVKDQDQMMNIVRCVNAARAKEVG